MMERLTPFNLDYDNSVSVAIFAKYFLTYLVPTSLILTWLIYTILTDELSFN